LKNIFLSVILTVVLFTGCGKAKEVKVGYASWISTSWEVNKFKDIAQEKLGDEYIVKLVAFENDVYVAQAFQQKLVDVIFTEDGTIGGEAWANLPFENGKIDEYNKNWQEFFKNYISIRIPTDVWYYSFYTPKKLGLKTIDDLINYKDGFIVGCPAGYYDRGDNKNSFKCWAEYTGIKVKEVKELSETLMLKAVDEGIITLGFSPEAMPLIYKNVSRVTGIVEQSYFQPQNYVIMCQPTVEEHIYKILFESLIPSTMDEFNEWYMETYGNND